VGLVPRQTRIVIFCGKGGVGKTTLSFSLALRCAEAGKRVVVVSSHPLRELAVTLSLAGIDKAFKSAAKNLFVVHIDPMELIADLVHKNFPSKLVADAVVRSSIYKNLVEVAPGLKEFQFLVRLQQLAERKVADEPDYDLLLWDAPASGHFLSTLHAARNFEIFLTGPLASAGADLARFFSNASHIALFPVTTLEEMAVEETIEMCGKLEADFTMKATAVLMNLVSPLATASEADIESLRGIADPALHFALERGLIERERASYLARKLPAAQEPVERVRRWSSDLDLLGQVGKSLDKLVADTA
jgi:anion-transporting  ArsA/GET3 family ATPase